MNEMAFKFYGQNVRALWIQGDSETSAFWMVWADERYLGSFDRDWTNKKAPIMRFVEKKILEKIARSS